MNENHFLIAMVDRKLTDESSKKRRLSDLPFHVLQTRNLLDYEKYLWLPVHPHTTNYSSPFSRSVVFRTSSTPEYSVYSSPRFPNIHLSLLHKRNQENEYTARGTLGTALETFQCLIQIGAPQNQIRTWTESVDRAATDSAARRLSDAADSMRRQLSILFNSRDYRNARTDSMGSRNLRSPNVFISLYADPIHAGHIEYIRLSKALADERGGKLIVCVNNDAQATLKKGRPFMKCAERLIILQALRDVDVAFASIDADRSVCASLRLAHETWGVGAVGHGGDRHSGK